MLIVDWMIAVMVCSAIAIVGVNRPSVAGISPSVFLIFCAFYLAIVLRPSTEPNQRRLTPIDLLLALWFTIKVIVEIFNSSDTIPLSIGPILDCLMVLMVVAIVKRRIASVRQVRLWCKVYLAAAVVVSTVALLQVVESLGVNRALVSVMGGSALEARIDNGWAIRATGTIGHWTALGGYLCVAIAVCCALMITSSQRRGLAAVLAVLVAGQVTTFTFATMAVSAAVLCATAFILRPRISHVFAVISVLGLLWLAFANSIKDRFTKQVDTSAAGQSRSSILPESIAFRTNIWSTETIPAIAQQWPSGHGLAVYNYVGTGRAPKTLHWQSPESEWMRTAITSGMFVLLLEVLTVSCVIYLLWSLARRMKLLWIYPILIVNVTMVMAMFIHSHLSDRAFMLSFWLVISTIQVMVASDAARVPK